MRRTFKKTALTQTAEEYASRSSIHGIGYVFDRDLNIVDRLLWLFVVIALLGGAAVFTWDFWSQWRDEQVINYTKQICTFQLVPKHTSRSMQRGLFKFVSFSSYFITIQILQLKEATIYIHILHLL